MLLERPQCAPPRLDALWQRGLATAIIAHMRCCCLSGILQSRERDKPCLPRPQGSSVRFGWSRGSLRPCRTPAALARRGAASATARRPCHREGPAGCHVAPAHSKWHRASACTPTAAAASVRVAPCRGAQPLQDRCCRTRVLPQGATLHQHRLTWSAIHSTNIEVHSSPHECWMGHTSAARMLLATKCRSVVQPACPRVALTDRSLSRSRGSNAWAPAF
jgi:hypothetical protein